MKIDVHGHVSAPESLYAYKAGLLSHRGAHGRGGAGVSDETLREALNAPNKSFGDRSHIAAPRRRGRRHPADLAAAVPDDAQRAGEARRVVHRGDQQRHRAASAAIEPDRFRGMAGAAAEHGDRRRAVGQRAAPLRDRARLRRRAAQPGPLRGHRAAAGARRPVLVPGVGGAVRARRAGADPLGGLPAAGAGDLLAALHPGGDARGRGAGLVAGLRRLPGPQDHRLPRRRGDPLPARPLRAQAIRAGHDVPRRAAQALLRHLPLHPGLDRAAAARRSASTAACSAPRSPAPARCWTPTTGRWIDDIHLLIEDIDWLDDGEREQLFETNARELFRI